MAALRYDAAASAALRAVRARCVAMPRYAIDYAIIFAPLIADYADAASWLRLRDAADAAMPDVTPRLRRYALFSSLTIRIMLQLR